MNQRNQDQRPTQKQLSYIANLAKRSGQQIDVSEIRTKRQASELIEQLAVKNGSNETSDDRDKRIAFGLSTKLVARRFLANNLDPTRASNFWSEVEQFFRTYVARMNGAM